MNDQEKIAALEKLIIEVYNNSQKFPHISKTALARESKALDKVLTELLGRAPTESEHDQATGW